MNKVELAKILGLEDDYNLQVSSYILLEVLEEDWQFIKSEFCEGKIDVEVGQDDLHMLDISSEDLIEDGDIEVCIAQVETLIWERAADEYLERVHKSAMLIGG